MAATARSASLDAENHRVPRTSKTNSLAEMMVVSAQYTSPISEHRPVILLSQELPSLKILELPISAKIGMRCASSFDAHQFWIGYFLLRINIKVGRELDSAWLLKRAVPDVVQLNSLRYHSLQCFTLHSDDIPFILFVFALSRPAESAANDEFCMLKKDVCQLRGRRS